MGNSIDITLKRKIAQLTPNAAQIAAPQLIIDLNESGLAGPELDRVIPVRELQSIKREILARLKELDRVRKLAYHNVNHTRSVYTRVGQLLKRTNLSQAEGQLLKFSALFHDLIHGSKVDNNHPDNLTFEEQSAIEADLYAKKIGLSTRQRVLLYGLIFSTTFSNPNIHPFTSMEKNLVIADLGGFNHSCQAWLLESWQVTQEIPADLRPKNLQMWLKEQKKFLEYVRKRLTPEALELSWDQALENKFQLIELLYHNFDAKRTFAPIVDKINGLLPTAV